MKKRIFTPISTGLSWKKLQSIFKKTQKKMDKEVEHNKEMMLSREKADSFRNKLD